MFELYSYIYRTEAGELKEGYLFASSMKKAKSQLAERKELKNAEIITVSVAKSDYITVINSAISENDEITKTFKAFVNSIIV